MQQNSLVPFLTDLQLGLIAIGALVVVGVILYNQWQAHKARKPRAMQPGDDLSTGPDDLPDDSADVFPPVSKPLMQASPVSGPPTAQSGQSAGIPAAARREPTFSFPGDTPAAAEASASDPASYAGSENSPADDGNAQAAAGADELAATAGAAGAAHWSEAHPKPGVIDPLIDCIVPVRLDSEVSGDRVLPLLNRLRRAGTKQIHVEGLRSDLPAWELVRGGHRYRELQVAVQLANRTGPLNALEFSEFISAVQAFCEQLDASADLPEMSEAVANARELDTFSAACDIQLGVNVLSDGAPWSAAYVQNIATQDGLVLSRDGTRFTRFHPGNDGVQRALLTLHFGDTNFLRDDLTAKAGHQITLLLDVPTSDAQLKPFKLICEYAYSLSQRMGARVVDDNLQPLTEASFVAIQKKLDGLYEALDNRGIPAGSSAAVRLFSH